MKGIAKVNNTLILFEEEFFFKEQLYLEID
jgi:hypothetical protein